MKRDSKITKVAGIKCDGVYHKLSKVKLSKVQQITNRPMYTVNIIVHPCLLIHFGQVKGIHFVCTARRACRFIFCVFIYCASVCFRIRARMFFALSKIYPGLPNLTMPKCGLVKTVLAMHISQFTN